jgi:ATP-dependent RNA helicase DDX31/DBP7
MIWIVIGSIMGGENIQKEKARLRKGINLLVTTPGRLIYHLQNTSSFKLDKLEVLVLEESDRILDMGFQKEMISIVAELEKKTVIQIKI